MNFLKEGRGGSIDDDDVGVDDDDGESSNFMYNFVIN